jgi:hypothetical protein
MNIHPKDTKEGKVYQIVKWSIREDWVGFLMQRKGNVLVSVGKRYGELDWGGFNLIKDLKRKSKQFQLKEIKDSEAIEMGYSYFPDFGWRKEKYPFKLTLKCVCGGEEFFTGEEGRNDEFGHAYIKTDDLKSIDLAAITESQDLLFYGSPENLITFLKEGVPSWLVLPENIAISYPLASFLKNYPKIHR